MVEITLHFNHHMVEITLNFNHQKVKKTLIFNHFCCIPSIKPDSRSIPSGFLMIILGLMNQISIPFISLNSFDFYIRKILIKFLRSDLSLRV